MHSFMLVLLLTFYMHIIHKRHVQTCYHGHGLRLCIPNHCQHNDIGMVYSLLLSWCGSCFMAYLPIHKLALPTLDTWTCLNYGWTGHVVCARIYLLDPSRVFILVLPPQSTVRGLLERSRAERAPRLRVIPGVYKPSPRIISDLAGHSQRSDALVLLPSLRHVCHSSGTILLLSSLLRRCSSVIDYRVSSLPGWTPPIW